MPDFSVAQGEKLAVIGPSGSGKTTLLNLIAGIIIPDDGNVRVGETVVSRLGDAGRRDFRISNIGFVFQNLQLLDYLSVLDNVVLPCQFSALRRQRVLARAASLEEEATRLLTLLQLADPELLKRRVSRLSIGQQQRVAAARALMGGPEIIIADEPTSALDAQSRDAFVDLRLQEGAGQGTTLLFVSHEAALAPRFDRTLVLETVRPVEVV